MKWPEHIEKSFVNDLESQRHADRGAEPGKVKVDEVVVSGSWKDHDKGQNLGDDVGEEKFKSAVLAATEHGNGNDRLENWMCDPESVKQDPDFLAHGGSFCFLSQQQCQSQLRSNAHGGAV